MSVKVGDMFRFTIGDCHALWKVLRKNSYNSWECTCQNEPVVINNKSYMSDYAGSIRFFATSELSSYIESFKQLEQQKEEQRNWYNQLQVGQIVHYCNGFDNFVRCKVVSCEETKDGYTRTLMPIGLVGNWKQYDLPRRLPDGEIYYGVYPDKIRRRECMNPHISNMYEHKSFRRGNVNPQTLLAITLDVPEMLEEEKSSAKKFKILNEIRNILDSDQNPDTAIANIRNIVEKA